MGEARTDKDKKRNGFNLFHMEDEKKETRTEVVEICVPFWSLFPFLLETR